LSPRYDKENYSLLAIAYYNLGTQHEFLANLPACKSAFQKAIRILKKYFEEGYPLTSEFENSLRKVAKKIRREKAHEKK